VSTAVATARPARTITARQVGWAGVALGVLAWFLALPPALLRSPVPSLALAAGAIGAGAWTVRRGERRLGWGAVAAGVIGAVGAVAATR
jgi:general nucleoside transport system permease protein